MSENSTPEERTEMPSDRRMGQMRREGQIHMSTEVVQVVSLIAGFLILQQVWPYLIDDLKYILTKSYGMIALTEPLTPEALRAGFINLVLMLAPDLLVIVLTVAAVSSLAVMLQTNWNIKEKKIHFRLHFLNPISGIKRIFSIHGVVNTIKALLKLAIIIPLAYQALKRFAPKMVSLIHVQIEDVMQFTGEACMELFWKITYILIALAIFDFFWGKKQWLKTAKMTKEEVKEERKSTEGDETTKRRIINKGLQRILQRIKQAVPQADVVVTNPTHYAVALKYDRDRMGAPTVVAKGQDHMALRIREIAKESGVPILERKALARALYASTEVGSEVPRELFKAVAEVLAYVYRIRPGKRLANTQRNQQRK